MISRAHSPALNVPISNTPYSKPPQPREPFRPIPILIDPISSLDLIQVKEGHIAQQAYR